MKENSIFQRGLLAAALIWSDRIHLMFLRLSSELIFIVVNLTVVKSLFTMLNIYFLLYLFCQESYIGFNVVSTRIRMYWKKKLQQKKHPPLFSQQDYYIAW